jgi:acyl transferase domain-containing protein/surfactin synthase thioesterase subunit
MADKEMILLLKRALYSIKLLKEQADNQANNVIHEPIAVVGMACRFPGGCNTPEKFWSFLKKGGDGVSAIPADRFAVNDYYDADIDKAGKMYIKEAGLLQEDITAFDAHFFGISPREAAELDPQHRILLELSWEALERGGIAPQQLKGSRTGVFIGQIGSEYGMLPRNIAATGPYTMTGILSNLTSGRIAHFFGFHGPAITIDTACSSSLVSTSLACKSLQNKECDVALAGGINLILTPEILIMLSKVRALAKDSRCKTFDADADGYGRGEGGGIIVLKRLADAEKNNDIILAVIKGSAINQDGPSSGLTVPNGYAQKELIKEALHNASVMPDEVSYIEAHGTGTVLGDPIEIQAITEVFGQPARKTPLYLGTVKANIGHLEAAAGIASIIKSILCLQHKTIVPHIHLKTLNPRINLEKIAGVIAKEPKAWEAGKKNRILGISSFGFSGTNAHLIMADYASKGKPNIAPVENELQMLALSAKTNQSLKALVAEYVDYLKNNKNVALANVCFTANTSRANFAHRICFSAKNEEQLVEQMLEFIKGKTVVNNKIIQGAKPKIAFVLLEQSTNQINDHHLLYRRYSIYREIIDLINKLFEPHVGYSLLDDLAVDSKRLSLPHIFTLQFAFVQLLISIDIKPSAIIGGKVSAYVMACIAGIMSLEKAIECIAQADRQSFVLNADDLAAPQISIISNDTGKLMKKTEAAQPVYWQNQISVEGSFELGVSTLLKEGYINFVLIGADEQNATTQIKKIIMEKDVECISFESNNLFETLMRGIGSLYGLGININWQKYYEGYHYHKLALPTYPFEKKRYWLEPYAQPHTTIENKTPLRGRLISSPLLQKQFEFVINLNNLSDLKDTGNIIHVGYFHEMLMHAVNDGFNTVYYKLLEMDFLSMLAILPEKTKTIYLIFDPQMDQTIDFQIYSKEDETLYWTLHIKGKIKLDEENFAPLPLSFLDEFKAQADKNYNSLSFYNDMQARGAILGETAKWINHVWLSGNKAIASFKPLYTNETDVTKKWSVPHGILDACAQLFHAILATEAPDRVFMVSHWNNFSFNYSKEIEELWCYVELKELKDNQTLIGNFQLFNYNGIIIANCEACVMKAVDIKRMQALRQTVYTEEEHLSQISKLEQLSTANASKRFGILEEYIQSIIAALLKIPLEELSLEESLRYLGIDSLVGIEFKNKIHADIGIDLPLEIFLEGPSIKELTQKLVELIPDVSMTNNNMPSEAEMTTQSDVLRERQQDTINTSVFKEIARTDLYLPYRKQQPKAKMRLFCFPYGGAGASIYRNWAQYFPEEIEVCPVQIPGRENLLNVTSPADLDELIRILYLHLAPVLDLPFAIYGHSYGSLVAFEFIRYLRRLHLTVPIHLFIGAFTAPHLPPSTNFLVLMDQMRGLPFDIWQTDVKKLTKNQIKAAFTLVTNQMEFDKSLLNNQELMRLLLPGFLADARGLLKYKHQQEEPLDIPITAFYSMNDKWVPKYLVAPWEIHTCNNFQLHGIDGEHLFINNEKDRKELINIIQKNIVIVS